MIFSAFFFLGIIAFIVTLTLVPERYLFSAKMKAAYYPRHYHFGHRFVLAVWVLVAFWSAGEALQWIFSTRFAQNILHPNAIMQFILPGWVFGTIIWYLSNVLFLGKYALTFKEYFGFWIIFLLILFLITNIA